MFSKNVHSMKADMFHIIYLQTLCLDCDKKWSLAQQKKCCALRDVLRTGRLKRVRQYLGWLISRTLMSHSSLEEQKTRCKPWYSLWNSLFVSKR